MRARRIIIFSIVMLVALAADQSSKAWARGALEPGVAQTVVDGYWDWELAYNPGIAGSMFVGVTGARVIFSVIAALAIAALVVAAVRARPDERLRRVAFALIAGGAAGNMIDRVRDGAVTDFIRWRIHDHRWPIFNAADALLLVGVVLLFMEGFFARRRAGATLSG
jgi:signal peptidase II